MRAYDLTHLNDRVLRHELKASYAGESVATAYHLARIAEYDARCLYVPDGYPSMLAYCVHELNMSNDAAFKRIQVARAARRVPALFVAVAECRIHLTAARMLAPHITPENADALLAEATYRTTKQVGILLARRFPRSESLPLVETVPAESPDGHAPVAASDVRDFTGELVSRPVAPALCSRVEPIAPRRFALHLSIDESTHDLLREAQELLGHRIPSGDIAPVLHQALAAFVPQLRKQKYAATSKPRTGPRTASPNPRHIPAHVQRAVWERDQGQCSFVSEAGQRCPARTLIEYDHVEPVARGGPATVEGIRLRCRTHNQYEAERVFGAGFMQEKRKRARRSRMDSVQDAASAAEPRSARVLQDNDRDADPPENPMRDVENGLRELGFHVHEARSAAQFAATLQGVTLEERMRAALQFFGRKARRAG